MSILSDTLTPEEWIESPAKTAAKALGCVVLAPACIAQHAASRSAEIARESVERAKQTVRDTVDAIGDAFGTGVEVVGGELERVIESTEKPIRAAAGVIKWYAIAAWAFALIAVVVGLIWILR